MRATELRSAGVLIPDTNMGLDDTINGQQVFFFERLRQMDADAARSLWRAKCDRLLAVARSEGLHTIVVSAENLLNPTSVALLIDEIDAEVEIIAYVRRQLDYLVSAWQQWYLKAYRSVDVFLHLNLGTVANWNLCLAQWESTFGRERIQIRRFDRTTLKGGDVVTDFRHTAGLPAAPSALQVEQVNTSYSDGFTALAMRVTDKFDTFAQYRAFYAMLSSLAGELADREQITTFPFTPDQVARIESTYQAGNEALRMRYFPEETGTLFPRASDAVPAFDPVLIRSSSNELIDRVRDALGAVPALSHEQLEFGVLLASLRDAP